jgi:hypothetical protein
MKPDGFHLLALIMAGSLAAEEPVPVAPPKVSARLKNEIRANLPPYTPPPPKVLDRPNDSPSDPDIFALPKFTVKEKRPPTHDPDFWLTERAVQQKAMAAYKQSMTDLEWALNSWFIPLITPPASARAAAAYENNKSIADLKRVYDLLGHVTTRDPKAGADLEKERVSMEQAEYWQRRVAGDGRKK